MPDSLHLVLLGFAAVAGGAVNALAGGGSLITFPALVAAGIPPLAANVSNTLAMCPGHFGAALAQKTDLGAIKKMMWRTLPAALAGGLLGGLLLLATGERVFDALVPYLILLAAALLAAQEPLRAWLARRTGAVDAQDRRDDEGPTAALAVPVVAATAVYFGYFGGGASVILLAALGLTLDGPLRRLMALKQVLALAANLAAAVLFAATGPVAWPAVLVMAVGALAGGTIGGRLAGRLSPVWLRRAVVAIGLAVGIIYLVR